MLVTLTAFSLAAAYATYVVARSDFPPMEWIRVKVFERWGEGSSPAYLVTCFWCVSAYTSAVLTLIVALVADVPLPGVIWLGAAMGSALLNAVGDLLQAASARL